MCKFFRVFIFCHHCHKLVFLYYKINLLILNFWEFLDNSNLWCSQLSSHAWIAFEQVLVSVDFSNHLTLIFLKHALENNSYHHQLEHENPNTIFMRLWNLKKSPFLFLKKFGFLCFEMLKNLRKDTFLNSNVQEPILKPFWKDGSHLWFNIIN